MKQPETLEETNRLLREVIELLKQIRDNTNKPELKKVLCSPRSQKKD